MNIYGRILKAFGWKVNITAPDYPKLIICVAPHTSNWDFILCKLAYAAVCRHAGFMMKSSWFFPPLGWIFKAIGGIPVKRKKGGQSLTQTVVEKFRDTDRLHIAITPEGTRSRTDRWHTGFLHIAHEAGIPIELGVIDFRTKTITLDTVFHTTGDTDADMHQIKAFYRALDPQGRRPHLFSTDEPKAE